jgi:predicted TIM-barrel fold metal-dependent hydrolase
MTTDTLSPVYPSREVGAPNDRVPPPLGETGLPAGTEVFTADTHISVAEDIYYENFPAHMKEQAPRLWYENGAFHIGLDHQSFLPEMFAEVVRPYHGLAGCSTGDMDARMADMEAEGITRELAFQNESLVMLAYPDHKVRDTCFRIYNEHMAKLQERYPGRFWGVGFINWWDPQGARETLAQLKALNVRTFLMPLKPGNFEDGEPIDYAGTRMIPVWEEIDAAGIPVSHHIGEGGGGGSEFNALSSGFIVGCAPFREMFGKYTMAGILDRHPALRIGWFEGGINWVPSAIQDADHCMVSFRHMNNLEIQHTAGWYWENHMMSAFMHDPLGLDLIARIGVDRVMWSNDYPHNESTWGYSQASLKEVVDKVGPQDAAKMVSGNAERYLGI